MVPVYKGSISTVFRAKCLSTGRSVIVKVYFQDKMTSKQMHKLEREVELQGLVKDCPYVCQLLAHFLEESKQYIILEDCEGGDLFNKMLKDGGSVPEAKVCTDVIVPLLRVLESLDKLHIIHRDIKPENIFLTGDGKIRLGDFGLAINCSKEIPFYRSGVDLQYPSHAKQKQYLKERQICYSFASGTLDYMAPEVLSNPCTRLEEGTATMQQLQVRHIIPYTTKVDIWAAGVLAYELVTGHPPFEVDNETETVRLILTSNEIQMPPCYTSEWANFVRFESTPALHLKA